MHKTTFTPPPPLWLSLFSSTCMPSIVQIRSPFGSVSCYFRLYFLPDSALWEIHPWLKTCAFFLATDISIFLVSPAAPDTTCDIDVHYLLCFDCVTVFFCFPRRLPDRACHGTCQQNQYMYEANPVSSRSPPLPFFSRVFPFMPIASVSIFLSY